MDKVICCYPDMGALPENATIASRAMVEFIVARDGGLVEGLLRLCVCFVNVLPEGREAYEFTFTSSAR